MNPRQRATIKRKQVSPRNLQGQSWCRCQNCRNSPLPGSLFCKKHQTCKGSPLSSSEPPYDPERYNKNPAIQDVHNCWDYGLDIVDPAQLNQCQNRVGCQPRFHQPGGTKGLSKLLQETRGRTCKVVKYLMRQDVPELRRTTFKKRCPASTSKIALVVHPGEDYHFYRQDSDGWWSHKDGANKVKRFDAEGKPIWNPKTAARDYRPNGSFLNYRDFCGFYCAPRRKTIKLSR